MILEEDSDRGLGHNVDIDTDFDYSLWKAENAAGASILFSVARGTAKNEYRALACEAENFRRVGRILLILRRCWKMRYSLVRPVQKLGRMSMQISEV